MRVVVVTGTDTGVGKTVVTAALAVALRLRGLRVAVVKPAQTGVAEDEPGDLVEVERLGGIKDVHEFARFPEPLAPATAARRAGMTAPSVREHATRTAALSDRDVVLIEGAGGLLVELDGDGGTVADLASFAPGSGDRRRSGRVGHTQHQCADLRGAATAGSAVPGTRDRRLANQP